MQIRKATKNDLPQLMELVKRVVPLMQALGNLQWDDSYPNAMVFQHDIDLEQLWVADSDGSVAGVAAITTDQELEYAQAGCNVNEAAVVIHRLAVDPARRGAGIAALLMKQAEDVARDQGITVLRVDTNTRNEATRSLFPKLGYLLAGEITLRHRPELRFLCYEKRLQQT
jgi:N-acetylglutamate synthase-like GNAT family acetyltransferase